MATQKIFFAILFLMFLTLCLPLAVPVILGGILAVLVFPIQKKLFSKQSYTSALIIAAGVSVLFLVPMALLLFLSFRAMVQLYRDWGLDANSISTHLNSSVWGDLWAKLPVLVQNVWTEKDFAGALTDITQQTAFKLGESAGVLLGQLPSLALQGFVTALSLFFFLVDGQRFLKFLRRISVFPPFVTGRLLLKAEQMCRSVVLATVVAGFAQSLVFSLVALALGVSHIPLIGMAVFFCSFLPVIGSLPVTFGLALLAGIQGNASVGLGLGVAALVVSVLDNVVRPWVLKDSGELHPLLAFIAAYGGLKLLGFSGIFIGPVIFGLAITALDSLIRKREGG